MGALPSIWGQKPSLRTPTLPCVRPCPPDNRGRRRWTGRPALGSPSPRVKDAAPSCVSSTFPGLGAGASREEGPNRRMSSLGGLLLHGCPSAMGSNPARLAPTQSGPHSEPGGSEAPRELLRPVSKSREVQTSPSFLFLLSVFLFFPFCGPISLLAEASPDRVS